MARGPEPSPASGDYRPACRLRESQQRPTLECSRSMELDPRSNANRERKMKYRTLGSTDIAVSEVGFGVWTVSTGWWGEVDDARSVRLLREARERGINYFDTADTYGSGKGETLLADAFGHVRDEVVISTKIGYDFYNHTARRGQQERPQDWSEEFIRFALEQSLKRLDTDYIDLLEQDPGRGLIEAARETGTSLIVRVPHSSGMLEGHYDENTTFAKNDHRRHRPKEWLTTGLKKVEQLSFLTESGERTLGQAALKFALASPEVVSTLPNIYGEEQIEEFAATSETPDLPPNELSRIAELYDTNFGLEASGAEA